MTENILFILLWHCVTRLDSYKGSVIFLPSFQAFGSAVEFVWSHNASEYAIREGTSTVKIHNNFKEKKSFKPEFGAEQIFTGPLLGVRGGDSLAFYDWDDAKLIRRIELSAEQVRN